MKNNSNIIAKKIALLNKVTENSLLEGNSASVVKNFTLVAIKILMADFGFAWHGLDENEEYKLSYKSPKMFFDPEIPSRKNHILGTKNYLFDSNVKKGVYKFGIERYLKSYVIIPMNYGDHVYGSIVVGFKQKHLFTDEELVLCNLIGNIAAQALNTHWMINQQKSIVALSEKHKEIEVLLEQEKLKTEFIANTTHEFRTPLTIMRGYVDLALRKDKSDLKDAKKALRIVNQEIMYLSEIISDLVIVTSGKNTKDSLDSTSIDVFKLAKLTVERLKRIAKEKNISIQVQGQVAQFFVFGNKKYLERLLLNLIENAVNYGKSKITVGVSNENGKVVIRVIDNGIGIASEDLPKIFERFFRADKSHSSDGKHSGLGLAMAKWIVEVHGGQISVQSMKNKGSIFKVSLPIKSASNK